MLLDVRIPGLDGIGLVEVLRRWGETTPVLMVSGFGTVESAVGALHAGADDFLTKPVEPEVLSARVEELLARRPRADGATMENPGGIIGRSAALRVALETIRRAASTDSTVLIQGETGTGKELAAQALHDLSPRREGPFVAVNCASLSAGVVKSELFGHVRGAFTGALQDRKEFFESAQGGTIFLDEIGDVPLEVQYRLLRALQEREVTPVGSVQPIDVDTRVVAATNRSLREAMEEGRFRDDLYYRLNVVRLTLPPLRERPGDLPLLVEAYLSRGSHDQRPPCSPLAMRLLQAYHWPANVRELHAALESSLVRAGGRIEAQHLPEEVRARGQWGQDARERYREPQSPEEERAAVVQALEAADGVRARAAELLGMGRTTLWRKMRQYGLDTE